MVYAMALHLEAAAGRKGSFVRGITYDFRKCFVRSFPGAAHVTANHWASSSHLCEHGQGFQ